MSSSSSMLPLLAGGNASSTASDTGSGSAVVNGYDSITQNTTTGLEGSMKERDDTTIDETKATHTLLDDSRARYSITQTLLCVFEEHDSWGTGTASVGNEILNLLKNIVGSGGLSLPAGIAAFGNMPSAILPSLVVILIMAIVNAYSFSMLGRVCHVTRSMTYQQAWDRSVGRRHGTKYNLWIGLVVTFKAVLGCWSFSIVIASTCQPLLQHFLSLVMDYNSNDDDDTTDHLLNLSKSEALALITAFVLLPLCLTFRLSSLAAFSFVGTVGTVVTAFTMALRYFDGTYLPPIPLATTDGSLEVGPAGKFYHDVPAYFQPQFGTDHEDGEDDQRGALSFFTSPQSLILVSILSQGYVAHYNAPKYYFELKDHTTGKFNVVVNVSFLLACITYMIISSLGFLTFGEHSSGFILDNYSYRDSWASFSRFGVGLSVIFAYPLLFHGGRDGLLALLGETSIEDGTKSRVVSALLLLLITILAITINDLTFVLSFSGATLSTAIIYIFPPMMFQSLVLNCTCMKTYVSNAEIKQSQAMMYLGAILGVCGAVVTVMRTFF